MATSPLKFRFRRLVRRRVRRTGELLQEGSSQVDKHFFARLGKLRLVWRLVAGWTLLFVVIAGMLSVQLSALKQYYQVLQPAPGGMYTEGVEGSFTTANPLYAVSDVDTTVSRLVFASLLTYDNQNHLVGDLADRWNVNDDGTVYTIHLRSALTWQDGKPLTADDVLFTYHTIQNADAQSPLFSSWQGVTVQKLDAQTVSFTLPNPLSSFPYSLTNGIVPRHLLQAVPAVDLRSVAFNTTSPVGAGPFRWSAIGVSGVGDAAEQQITLVPFRQYWAGSPRLSSFSIDAFASQGALLSAYRNRQVTAAAGLSTVPADIAKDRSSHVYNLPLTAGTYVFFNTKQAVLQDAKVRQALVLAANRSAILAGLGYSAIPVDEPLLHGQLGYNPAYAQVTGQAAQAAALLDADGWKLGAGEVRTKDGQPLSFTLTAVNDPEFKGVAQRLRAQWRAIGIGVTLNLQQPADFQAALSPAGSASTSVRPYDAIVDGISIGVDPDVFVYWDSSQADVRSATQLNFSSYTSDVADASLEAGRTRLGDALRAIKYQPFLQAWQQDAPALGLYQPRFVYISHVHVYGLGKEQINTDADRFTNVQNWMIHTAWVTRRLPS
ncbi:MAG TPA: ABC transporter substrate-binding protein [Candidatus Saccharimonadales bacterium]|nr:ABC transporter substrate-binding protein [Candidatus Saccharimonadales bacterium]